MTPTSKAKLKAFVLTLLLFAVFAVLVKVVRLGHRIDAFKAAAAAPAPKKAPRVRTYRERCEDLGGVHVTLLEQRGGPEKGEACMLETLPGE